MPQNALAATIAKNPSNAQQPALLDAAGLLMSSKGGIKSTLNVTAAAVIKASAGRVAKIVIVAPGSTSGAFTLNDCATTGAATVANEIITIPYNATNNVAGTVIDLDFPVSNGIVVSAVPGAGSPQLSISWS